MTKKFSSTVVLLVSIVLLSFTVGAQELHPQIQSVSPTNNEMDVSTLEEISVEFTKDMDSSTITNDSFTVIQQTTPEDEVSESRIIPGTVMYTDRTATFTPDDRYIPNQEYGNVITARLTTDIADNEGNPLTQDYVWSFTLGENPFNTGDSTMQENQTSTLVSAPADTSEQTNNTTSTVVPTTTDDRSILANPFFWGLLALIGLLLALLIGSMIMGSKTTRRKDSFFGKSYPIQDLEGIGPKYAKRLEQEGVTTTKELWEADAVVVANKIRAPTKSVMHWQHMAELASITSIGPQYAELLDRSGIHSIKQLQEQTPNKLLKAVQEKEDSLNINIQGNTIGRQTVQNWIHEARNHEGATV